MATKTETKLRATHRAMMIITDVDGTDSHICRTYRVWNGKARLFVGSDRKVWFGDKNVERFSLLAKLGPDDKITKDATCHAASCW